MSAWIFRFAAVMVLVAWVVFTLWGPKRRKRIHEHLSRQRRRALARRKANESWAAVPLPRSERREAARRASKRW